MARTKLSPPPVLLLFLILLYSSSFYNCFAQAQTVFCYNDELEAFGHCYLIINHKMTWMESEMYCQSRGANLVRIDGMEENDWLAKVIPGDAWIGLQRLGNNSQSPYGWIPTLDKPVFEMYAPNLRYEDHRCMELETNGTWDDDACWMMQFAICERNPNSPLAIYPRLDKLEKLMEEIRPGGLASYSGRESWGLLASLESRLFSTTIIFAVLLVLVLAVMLVVFVKLRRIAPYSSSWGTVTASSLERRSASGLQPVSGISVGDNSAARIDGGSEPGALRQISVGGLSSNAYSNVRA